MMVGVEPRRPANTGGGSANTNPNGYRAGIDSIGRDILKKIKRAHRSGLEDSFLKIKRCVMSHKNVMVPRQENHTVPLGLIRDCPGACRDFSCLLHNSVGLDEGSGHAYQSEPRMYSSKFWLLEEIECSGDYAMPRLASRYSRCHSTCGERGVSSLPYSARPVRRIVGFCHRGVQGPDTESTTHRSSVNPNLPKEAIADLLRSGISNLKVSWTPTWRRTGLFSTPNPRTAAPTRA